jgi:serine/threonine protein kinase
VENAEFFLVYELPEMGSLETFLKDDLGRIRLGSFVRRVQIAIDVLTAIRFLHEGNKDFESCFHRDINPANILIKRDFTAQLTDCGLAKFVNDQIKTSSIKGTRGYICPQYVKTGKYLAACDIYSFGVVLLELWTGKLQNHEDESGAMFNFGEEYLYEGRDVKQDVDVAMDLADPLLAYSKRFTQLALHCINERVKDRPSGVAVLNELKDVLVGCFSSPKTMRVDGTPSESEAAEACSTCRTMPSIPPHKMCAVCLLRKEIRDEFSSTVVVSRSLGVVASTKKIEVNQTLEGRGKQVTLEGFSQEMGSVIPTIDAALPVLACLDRRLNNPIPRTFLLLPGDITSGFRLRNKIQKRYYLFFLCPVLQQAVSPPIKLNVTKDWLRKAAPVLATSLYLLQMSTTAGLNVNPDADGVASYLIHVSSNRLSEMLQELSAILDESNSRGLLDRLRAQDLTDQDVRDLNGEAYELVIEKACEQAGWRSQMEPVRLPPSPAVFWVAKSVAQDPMFEIIVD